ncbi:MAG: phosphoribosylformylglycinamidine synthase subunit PurL [Desulforudis sp.]|nr:MAG: phosphoribosylformylglycinamidine synthase subunit PurL [Desulforudis sp.]
MSIQEIRVCIKPGLPDARGEEVLAEVRSALPIATLEQVRTAKVYRFEGISPEEAGTLAENLLAESVFQTYTVNQPIITDADWLIEVAYKPGVMNPEAASLVKAAGDLGLNTLTAADSSWEYAFYGRLSTNELDLITRRLLVNDTVQHIVTRPPETLVISGESNPTRIIPIREMDDGELLALSKDRLFLSLEEMRLIQQYFRDTGRDPTDCEIEILAQTWSEHCVHKTFKARVVVNGVEKKPFLKRLQEATEQINHPLVLSAFVDNSGVMDFYDGWAVCGKVETHNSPSAIEPYGGAATGSGGVFRDVMGTGQGAKVIASTDMFCFGPPDLPWEDIPPGCLHPRYLLRRVVAGVRDYGNRMGIPTNNGSLHFHRDFRAKPTVIVGSYGLLPRDKATKGEPREGDLIIAIGGRTGRDGIHGATFSSAAMTERTISVNAQAVQIGHPIEEKRMHDVILMARDEGLIQAITDCGAGGFASAVGEMGADIGALIALDRVPLKYSGLAPWEILLSESQERMVVAVAPQHEREFIDLCTRYNVEATVLGTFTGDGRFRAMFDGRKVMDLGMDFLHDGLPQRVMPARWEPKAQAEPPSAVVDDWMGMFSGVLGHLNVCSKEPIVRVYDHGVQGSNALPPFNGVDGDAPNDSAVLTPLLGKPYGMVIGHGLNPVLNRIDPYWGTLWAATEAVSNLVAVGANPDEIMLIDNFIWPVPDEEMMGALDRAVDACTDFSVRMGMPFISGKDSLSSTYRTSDGQVIQIPPVVCVSAFGRIADVRRTVSSDFKGAGTRLLLLGQRDLAGMGGSTFYDLLGYLGQRSPQVDLDVLRRVFAALYRQIQAGRVLSCHDISEGGLGAALAEMSFGGAVGAKIAIPSDVLPEQFLFNETPGCFVLEVDSALRGDDLFPEVPWLELGQTTPRPVLNAVSGGRELFNIALADLKQSWQKPMNGVFGE